MIYTYLAAAFILGSILGWMLKSLSFAGIKRNYKALEVALEKQKKLEEQNLQEIVSLQQSKLSMSTSLEGRCVELEFINKKLEAEFELLQSRNEEIDALLKAGNPQVHSLKLKLIEANNTILRYKARLGPVE